MSNVRQAVILIHGVGEQRPMETLRSFVDAVLNQPAADRDGRSAYYNKPDRLSDNFELRRLASKRYKTDFFEFYWAHMIPAAPWDRLLGWYLVLMQRRWSDVPRRFRGLWVMSWLLLIIIAGWGLYVGTRFLLGYPIAAGPLDRAPWFVLSGLAVLSAVVRGHVGDAAVYLSPSPANIEARQKIRAAGLELLENVRASGRYDRIIIVGHSLGSVIGYDVLTLAWQRHVDDVRKSQTDRWAKDDKFQINTSAIVLAEALAREIRGGAGSDGEAAAARWREATRAVAVEQEANGSPWMVTDFITLGSPLAHGDLLLARNRLDFERRAREHELPNCPPVIEGKGVFSFEHEGRDSRGRQEALVLNHAALFAATVWTNLYFPCRAILWGDVVGGPVAPVFSGGVRDILVRTARRRGWLAHTLYWNWDDRDREFATSPVQQLRLAMDLPRREMKAPAKDSSDKAAKAGLEESTAAIPLP